MKIRKYMKIRKIFETNIEDILSDTIFSEYFDSIKNSQQLKDKILNIIKDWLNVYFEISKNNKGRSEYNPKSKIISFEIFGNELKINFLTSRSTGFLLLDKNDTEDLLSYIEDPSTYEDRKNYNL